MGCQWYHQNIFQWSNKHENLLDNDSYFGLVTVDLLRTFNYVIFIENLLDMNIIL